MSVCVCKSVRSLSDVHFECLFVSQLLGLFWEPLAYLRSRTSLAEVGDQLLILTCSLIPGQLPHMQLLLHAPSTPQCLCSAMLSQPSWAETPWYTEPHKAFLPYIVDSLCSAVLTRVCWAGWKGSLSWDAWGFVIEMNEAGEAGGDVQAGSLLSVPVWGLYAM